MLFAVFQLHTADGVTENSSAAARLPPSASMKSETVIPEVYSSCLKIVKRLECEWIRRQSLG